MKARIDLFLPSVKPPGKASSRNLQMHPYNGALSCHPLLESDDVIFHILKGAHKRSMQKQLPHINLCFLVKLIKRSLENRQIICTLFTPWVIRFVKKKKKIRITSSQISGSPKPLLAVTSSRRCKHIHHCTGSLPSMPL